MTINGVEIDFDMDRRADAAKFRKAFSHLNRKQNAKDANDSDMEEFLMSCLGEAATKDLLSDGRVSTLIKAFVSFFNEAAGQYESLKTSYAEAADVLTGAKARAAKLAAELSELTNVPG